VPSFDGLSRVLGLLAAILGTFAAGVYWRAGLTLSHYDAKAHLVVARRIFDSLTPSWEQIGAVWLPLPHLLNAIPVQIDWMYRTGASAIAISIVSFAITTASVSAIVRSLTGSRTGAIVAALLFALNPNILYLQSTPMTEPLLFALTSLGVLHLVQWAKSEAPAARPAVGWTIVLACLTRYEAWPVVGTAIVIAGYVKWRNGLPGVAALHEVARLALYPIGTALFFMGMSYASTGQWFVTGGFYVPDPKLQGQPAVVWDEIRQGLAGLAGNRFVQAANIAAVVIVLASLRRKWAGLLLTLAPLAAVALPFYAFMSGHPFRIRYEVPLILAGAVAIGGAVSMLRWLAPLVALPLLLAIQVQVPMFSTLAPMVIEAQLDRHNSTGRRAVTECLRKSYDGTTIMASMGSLAHYMQELSVAGFDLDDFLHEGSGPIWQQSYYYEPSLFAGWVMVEEKAEGGDMLAQKQRAWPAFLAAYERVCDGGNVALYRRKE
jgi:hypothetical protein